MNSVAVYHTPIYKIVDSPKTSQIMFKAYVSNRVIAIYNANVSINI